MGYICGEKSPSYFQHRKKDCLNVQTTVKLKVSLGKFDPNKLRHVLVLIYLVKSTDRIFCFPHAEKDLQF